METILDIVKNHVSVPEGAAYCLGMTDGNPTEISCPCHDDEDASMQLYDNHYHCPVCGATGDVTELVAKKMHVSKITAAASLAYAFSIPLPVSVDDETAEDLLTYDGVTCTFYRVLTMYSDILKIIKKKSDTRKPEQLTWLDFLVRPRLPWIEYVRKCLISGDPELREWIKAVIVHENTLRDANHFIDKMGSLSGKEKTARQTSDHGNDQKGN